MAEDMLSQLWANAQKGYGAADQTVMGATLPKLTDYNKKDAAGGTDASKDTSAGSNSMTMAANGQTVNLGNSSQPPMNDTGGGAGTNYNGSFTSQLIQNQGISGYGS